MAKKIVVVEDDEKISCALSLRLSAAGFRVYVAPDPVHGMRAIAREEPDLVLVDLMMPAGGGVAVIERMKRLAELVSIPVMVITASKQQETRNKALELGALDIVDKPFESTDLIHRINRVLGQQSIV